MQDLDMFAPGPTHVPLDIRMASVVQLTHHRSADFKKLFDRIHGGLQYLFRTSGQVLMLPASGTGAMESVVANIVAPGDPVLVLAAGKYGRRWAELCGTYQADVRLHEVPDGATFELGAVERELASLRPRHLLLTHCETSTGTVHDVERIAALGRRYGATVVVDTMTSVGVEPFHMDDWGVDFALTASHKGLMSPPGAAFVAVREPGWDVVHPRGYSYWNFHLLRESARESTVPNTPPNATLFAVAAGLDRIEAEGLEHVWERHASNAAVCRAGLEAMGLPMFTRGRPSHSLTAAALPADGRADDLVEALHERFGIRVVGGQGGLKGKIIRIGHIGSVAPLDLLPVLTALEILLLERGFDHAPGLAPAAMATVLFRQQGQQRLRTA